MANENNGKNPQGDIWTKTFEKKPKLNIEVKPTEEKIDWRSGNTSPFKLGSSKSTFDQQR